ncbi:MAG TPA: phage/plasmid primase, P4 family [Pyrinomonadaceae bacterium]|jgi:P4 family phage/plasmid primase-like protien
MRILKDSNNYNIIPSVETDNFLKSDSSNESFSGLEFDFSDHEIFIELTDKENQLFDEANSLSSNFASAFFFWERGIAVFPADGKHSIADATTDFSKLARMCIESPDAKPAIATGCQYGIVAIRYDVFIRMVINAYNLKPSCQFPIKLQERNTWQMTKFSPMWREREDCFEKITPLLEQAAKNRNPSEFVKTCEAMTAKCTEYGEDEKLLFFRVEQRDDLKLPSFDGFYGDGTYVVDEGSWDFSTHLLENENTPPKLLPQELFNYLMDNSVDVITNELTTDLTDQSNSLEIVNSVNEVIKIEECNDDGNARRFVSQHGEFVRYSVDRKKWFVYDEKRWKPDATMEVQLRAKYTVRRIAIEAASTEISERQSEKLLRHAQKSKHAKGIKDMLTMAESDLAIQESKFDRDKWLLNVSNGTIDLRTGKLRPHRREDFITKLIDIDYDLSAQYPKWLSFLNRIMDDNQDLISFLRRAIGYSLTGEVNERAVFVLFGNGANGKSVFAETVLSLLGDYSAVAPASAVMKKVNNSNTNDLAKLRGARFVSVNETDEGGRIDESVIKAISGNDKLTVRFLYGEFFEFIPEFKLWLRTNHKPTVRGTDEGIWDRLKLIPFAVRIPKHEQNNQLMKELQNELSGILNWAVEGCLEWQRDGLGVPQEVDQATNEYRKEQDTFSLFISQCCDFGEHKWASTASLRKEYEKFCIENGEQPHLPGNAFSERLRALGCIPKSARQGRGWSGIGLLVPQ